MNNKNNVADILKVLEEIRGREAPEVPSDVVRQILEVQFDNYGDRASARAKTTEVVDAFLRSVN